MVDVPSVNKFVDVVLILPTVIVSVPLINNGTDKVTPVELELLTVRPDKLAEVAEVEFLKVPEPEIV